MKKLKQSSCKQKFNIFFWLSLEGCIELQAWARWIKEAPLDLDFYQDQYVKGSSISIFNGHRPPTKTSIIEDSRKSRFPQFFSSSRLSLMYLEVIDLEIPRSSRSKQLFESILAHLGSIFVKIMVPSIDLAYGWQKVTKLVLNYFSLNYLLIFYQIFPALMFFRWLTTASTAHLAGRWGWLISLAGQVPTSCPSLGSTLQWLLSEIR